MRAEGQSQGPSTKHEYLEIEVPGYPVEDISFNGPRPAWEEIVCLLYSNLLFGKCILGTNDTRYNDGQINNYQKRLAQIVS